MSYTVLARRYRSGTFDEVIGQEHIAQTLKKAIESGRIAHAYLFCGTRGTGKTSTARILAKALNCQSSDGPTTEPCGQCVSCKAIARGEDMDVIEIDAASNTSVENVRDIIDNSQFRPAHSRFKVYIIDEVHMLSKSAFNALLKTLEEPPAHVKFILATTEPEKVLPTILSRCQRYDFRNIPTRRIAEHLEAICQKEKIQADADALLLIAKAGAGSMRDALSLLDRLLSIGQQQLSTELIEQFLGLPRSQVIYDLAQAIAESDTKSALEQADAIVQSGLSTDSLLQGLVDHLRNLLILRSCGPESNLVEVPGLAMNDLVQQARRFDPVALTQDIAILEDLRRQMRLLQGGRALLDATLVRLTLADQFNSIADLLAGSPATPPAGQKKKFELSEAKGSEAGVQSSGLANPEPESAEQVSSTDSTESDVDELPSVGKVWEGERRSMSEIFANHRKASTPPPTAPSARAEPAPASAVVDPNNPAAVWQALLSRLADQGAGLHGILAQGRLAGIADGQAVIEIAPWHETFLPRLNSNGKKDLIRDQLSQLLQQPVGVRFQLGQPDASESASSPPAGADEPTAGISSGTSPAPSVPAGGGQLALTQELREEIEADPMVHAVMQELGGQLVGVRMD